MIALTLINTPRTTRCRSGSHFFIGAHTTAVGAALRRVGDRDDPERARLPDLPALVQARRLARRDPMSARARSSDLPTASATSAGEDDPRRAARSGRQPAPRRSLANGLRRAPFAGAGQAGEARLPRPAASGRTRSRLRSADGALLAEEFISVRELAGRRPDHGCSRPRSTPRRVPSCLRGCGACAAPSSRSTTGWSATPRRSAAAASYRDPLGRDARPRRARAADRRDQGAGAVAQAYAPVYAADPSSPSPSGAGASTATTARRNRSATCSQIMDPGERGWQRHWLAPTAGRRHARVQRLPPRHLRLSARAR